MLKLAIIETVGTVYHRKPDGPMDTQFSHTAAKPRTYRVVYDDRSGDLELAVAYVLRHREFGDTAFKITSKSVADFDIDAILRSPEYRI